MTRFEQAEKIELLALGLDAMRSGAWRRSERKHLDNATTLLWALIHDLRTVKAPLHAVPERERVPLQG